MPLLLLLLIMLADGITVPRVPISRYPSLHFTALQPLFALIYSRGYIVLKKFFFLKA